MPPNSMSNLRVPPLGLEPGLASASSSIFDLPITGGSDTSVQEAGHPDPKLQVGSATRIPTARAANHWQFMVISGGTGCNDICGSFSRDTCYVLPVSDDGGSSSEIIRVLGGPSIGNTQSSQKHRSPLSHPKGIYALA